jgi:hypothetical protein
MNGGRREISTLRLSPFDKPVLSAFVLRQAQYERVEACGEPVEPGSGRPEFIRDTLKLKEPENFVYQSSLIFNVGSAVRGSGTHPFFITRNFHL